ncbi:DUF3606 domain-containing protein [Variovorax sp. GB1R11]|uniref:DUF3606 domain-containing protein n=1 Tax=Variovorax sp. GB1R11 TaxID=3443741 RepID=UPI003F471935
MLKTSKQTIHFDKPADARAWARHLACSEAELRIATRAAGTSAIRVNAYLDALNGRKDVSDGTGVGLL